MVNAQASWGHHMLTQWNFGSNHSQSPWSWARASALNLHTLLSADVTFWGRSQGRMICECCWVCRDGLPGAKGALGSDGNIVKYLGLWSLCRHVHWPEPTKQHTCHVCQASINLTWTNCILSSQLIYKKISFIWIVDMNINIKTSLKT